MPVAFAVMLAALIMVAVARPVAADAAIPSWQSYVLAPDSRQVEPAAVLATSSAGVTDANALLAPGGGAARLERPVEGQTRWPQGTTASASSTYSGPGGYVASNTIDGDTSSYWNDDTKGAYPDTLTISSPTPVTLPGVTLVSREYGWPVDFTVETWDGSTWVQQATVSGNADLTRPIRFDHSVTTTGLRLTVTHDQLVRPEWGEYTRVAELIPGIVGGTPYVDLDFGREVAGNLELSIAGASDPAPEVRVAFSETRKYLGDRSDFSRSDFTGGTGTDNHVPSPGGETWVDRTGCQFDGHVCADGLRGFRYVRIYLGSPQGDAPYAADTGHVDIDAVRLHFTPYLGTPDTFKGHFVSSDDLLNRIWYASAYTVELNMDTFAKDSVDPRGSWDSAPDLHDKPALLDGPKRDRSPGNADMAVAGLTDMVSHAWDDPIRNVQADLAIHQRADGYVPYGPILNFSVDLFDYSAWWVVASQMYTLYSGDLDYARTYWPTLERLMDQWFPAVTDADGLLSKGLDGTGGYGDYQFSSRQGEGTYYNAMYVLALRDGAALARKLGHATTAAAWNERAEQVAQRINARLWDTGAGAYTEQGTQHWEDGNSMAVVAGVADAARARSVTGFMTRALTRDWGNATNDSGSDRVYPLFNYYDALARFRTGDDDGALELIRRTWGWMLDHGGPGTTWEAIGPGGDFATYEGTYSSMAHGWSAGAAAALSTDVLGIRPTGYGFDRYAFIPHPGRLAWTRGAMPSPHGSITASWHHDAGSGVFAEHLDSPGGTVASAGVPTFGRRINVSVDGTVVWNGTKALSHHAHSDGRYVFVEGLGPGSHHITSHAAGPPVRELSAQVTPVTVMLRSGESTQVDVTVRGQAPDVLTGTVTADSAGGLTVTPSPASFTLDGREGPASTTVRLTLAAPADASGGEHPVSLSIAAGGLRAHADVDALVLGHWPRDTTATASSFHAPNYAQDGSYRTYEPANTIDGDPATFWNDDTSAAYPDVLTITAPQATTLRGVGFVSHPDGVPTDFTVQTWNGSDWIEQARVTGNAAVTRWIPFAEPVSTTTVRLVVTADQTVNGEFTRVAELTP